MNTSRHATHVEVPPHVFSGAYTTEDSGPSADDIVDEAISEARERDEMAKLQQRRERNRKSIRAFRQRYSAKEFHKLREELAQSQERCSKVQMDLDVACSMITDLRKQLAAAKAYGDAPA